MAETVITRDDLEADVRRMMAEHAAILPRGFDSEKRRAILHRLIDSRLDDLATA